mmetsp:Transcript_23281/g.66718  ORF Transcript_23281/g.66718 Transcript_23281/m.66718 type:complete len:276 (+) Transcript_23281:8-835(+)
MASGSYSTEFGGGLWRGHGDYMRDKNDKIKAQLDQRYAGDMKSNIFQGVIARIDGHTELNDFEIKRLITQHGGQMEQYDEKRVTHLVADNLAMGNQRWRHYRDKPTSKFVVVKSSWVAESVAAGRRLREADFKPDILHHQGQGSLKGFLQLPKAQPQPQPPPVVKDNPPGGAAGGGVEEDGSARIEIDDDAAPPVPPPPAAAAAAGAGAGAGAGASPMGRKGSLVCFLAAWAGGGGCAALAGKGWCVCGCRSPVAMPCAMWSASQGPRKSMSSKP